MTRREHLLNVKRLKQEGLSVREISDNLGITTSAVYKMIWHMSAGHAAVQSCVYPNIAKWMLDNVIGYTEIANATGLAVCTIHNSLKGLSSPSKFVIDKILQLTELTYEQAFYRPEENNDHSAIHGSVIHRMHS